MDIATIIGIAGGAAIVVTVLILDGGSPGEIFAVPSALLLTLGGSLVAATATVSLGTLLKLPKFFMIAFLGKKENHHEAIEIIAVMADKARRESLLALEEEGKKIKEPFLRKGIQMVVDGIEPAQVRAILELEIEHMIERHHNGINFFNAAGGFAPTFGIIGTVMGLISVLKKLSDPEALAVSIAAAFLATLWGLLSANLIWMPIGGKLQHNSTEEAAYRHMLVEGIVSLQAGENPRLVREKLSAFLAPSERHEGKGAKAEAAPEGKQAGAKA